MKTHDAVDCDGKGWYSVVMRVRVSRSITRRGGQVDAVANCQHIHEVEAITPIEPSSHRRRFRDRKRDRETERNRERRRDAQRTRESE